MKMYYYQSVKDNNGYIYSCDSVRLEIKVDVDTLERVSKFCACNCDKYYMSLKAFSYKHCFTFNIPIFKGDSYHNVSFSCLCGLNTFGKIVTKFVVDFNPNKCMEFSYFKKFMVHLFLICFNFNLKRTSIKDITIRRYDLALDVPYARERVFVRYCCKGAKLHEVYETCPSNRTDYYGERNHVGRLKVYNKSLEDLKDKSKAEKDYFKENGVEYTRIEITHDTCNVCDLISCLPNVYSPIYDWTMLPSGFNSVDFVLVNACLENQDYIPYLKQSRKKWEKLKDFILSNELVFDIGCITKVLTDIFRYTDPNTYNFGDLCYQDEIYNRVDINSIMYVRTDIPNRVVKDSYYDNDTVISDEECLQLTEMLENPEEYSLF